MKKIIGSILVGLMLIGCSTKVSTTAFDEAEQLSFDSYQAFLDDKRSGIVYFGWVINCGDSQMLQENYLYELLEENPELQDNFYIVDLDKELPEGLADKTLREPMTQQFGVKYGPTMLHVVDGVVIDIVEWTPLTADKNTAIAPDLLDNFFLEAGY